VSLAIAIQWSDLASVNPELDLWRLRAREQHEHHHNLGILLPKASRLQMVILGHVVDGATVPRHSDAVLLSRHYDLPPSHSAICLDLASDLHIL
jgi:hypothetical protein